MQVVRKFSFIVDGATFTFRKPTAKELLGFSEKGLDNIRIIFSGLEKVEGLRDEDGRSIEPGELQTLDLPMETILQITNAWNEAVRDLIPGQSATGEKKTSTTP